MPAPPPPSASAPIASAVAPDNFIVTTQAMPRVPSPDARPLPINPITGEPEREIIGIGAMLAKDDEGLRIRDVLPGSPAALANLSGCVIQTVDGVNVANLSMNECVLLIRGLEGSAVKLEVLDPAQQRQTIKIVRNKVRL
jgi:C-terminal processing protease CtpA/Prc